ncbi:hypothetical protein [Pectobacterium peruviense]|uniref:hypothetical protein n=1 Tax=Pectobacterium peruviense TaxID=2066479 RepID=UPI001CB9B162|nr:hypothetical protein [Pectobacterium peruviense]
MSGRKKNRPEPVLSFLVSTSQNPEKVVMDLVTEKLKAKTNNYRFDMSNEPVLSSLGLNAPSLPHADFAPVSSLAKRTIFFRELKEKEDALKTRSQKV